LRRDRDRDAVEEAVSAVRAVIKLDFGLMLSRRL
jgi:hypothetical protein